MRISDWSSECALPILSDAVLVIAEGYPDSFAAPAAVDDLAVEWQARCERGTRLWRLFGFEPRLELHIRNYDLQFFYHHSSFLRDDPRQHRPMLLDFRSCGGVGARALHFEKTDRKS